MHSGYGGYSRYSDYHSFGDSYSDHEEDKEGCYFTCQGLYSLMQLKRLSCIVISRHTFLLQNSRSRVSLSDMQHEKEMVEFTSWNDGELQGLLDAIPGWHAFKRKQQEKDLAGEE
jgi:hypothetical protein